MQRLGVTRRNNGKAYKYRAKAVHNSTQRWQNYARRHLAKAKQYLADRGNGGAILDETRQRHGGQKLSNG